MKIILPSYNGYWSLELKGNPSDGYHYYVAIHSDWRAVPHGCMPLNKIGYELSDIFQAMAVSEVERAGCSMESWIDLVHKNLGLHCAG